MQLKIYPPEEVDEAELESELDKIQPYVEKQAQSAHKDILFTLTWNKETNPIHYLITITYGGSGRLKDFTMKRMIKLVMRKFDKHIKVK